MVYQTLSDANVTSLSGLFVYISTQVPLFMPMLLFALFMITLLSSYYAQQRTRGYGNFWGSFSVAGYFIAVVSVVMSLVPGLVNIYVVIVCIVVAIIGTAIFLSKDNDF